jgi:hypothetical protein
VCEHGEDAAVAVFAFGYVEFHEEVADVRLDGALAEVEALGDACVGEAFGHQLEHVAFPVGELSERVVVALCRDAAGDDLGVERGSSLGDAFGGG